MREGVGYLIALASFLASTPAMTTPAGTPSGNCHVVDGQKLMSSVSASLICDEVRKAVAAQAPGVLYSAEIKVLSPSRLAATLTVEGHILPVQNFAVMDRNLTEHAVKQFAASLASVVKAQKA